MLNKIVVFLTGLLIYAGSVRGQGNDIFTRIETKNAGEGVIDIRQSTEIENLVLLHLAQMKSMRGIKGYRVCIYYNSGQEANKGADQERARFISRYEDIKCYKSFESPFFKVYAGDFRTKSEALKFLERIRFDYPNAFIRDNITIAFPD